MDKSLPVVISRYPNGYLRKTEVSVDGFLHDYPSGESAVSEYYKDGTISSTTHYTKGEIHNTDIAYAKQYFDKDGEVKAIEHILFPGGFGTIFLLPSERMENLDKAIWVLIGVRNVN